MSIELDKKTENKKKVVFAFVMGLVTTMVISFAILSINIGFREGFLELWLRSWLLAYMFVIPTILFVAPVVQRFTDRLIGG